MVLARDFFLFVKIGKIADSTVSFFENQLNKKGRRLLFSLLLIEIFQLILEYRKNISN